RLKAGTRLPSSRALATDLGISRGLVVEAYAQLEGEGYLEARRGSGTWVATHAGRAPGPRGPVPGPAQPATPRIDFRPGAADLSGFPRTAWAAALRRAALRAPPAALGYPDPRGVEDLRTALAAYLGRVRRVDAEAGGVMVTSGFAQGLTLLAKALPARYGRVVAVEDPGSPGAVGLLGRAGLRVVPVGVDAEGLRAGELRATAARVALVTPAHQFPNGVVLGPRRRAELLDWAATRDGLIVEDDYDAEFRYDREPVGALQGLAPDLVVYAGSLSKTLAPALRLGWLVPPHRVLESLTEAKHDADLGSPTLGQLAFADLLGSGAYDRHLRAGRTRHRRRRDALVRALAAHAPSLRVRGTAAGLHAVVELPPGTDEQALVRRAAAAGVGLHGLGGFHIAGRSPVPGLVLGYGSLSESEIDAGVRVLAGLLEARA
ncbi:MAG TPA: PLP-dependent aminotransferase family protein, partial [Actinomycetes bacterium]|nr:PLP-dependent aminotransferase family protein [Actinomycetes bacterium]